MTGTATHCLQSGFFLLGFRNLRHNPLSFGLAPSNCETFLQMCLLCEDTGWVFEAHPDQPWEGAHA
jgi:hypothetical protein